MAQRSKQRGRTLIIIAFILILVVGLLFIIAKVYPGMLGQSQGPSATAVVNIEVPVVEETVDIVITTQAIGRGMPFREDALMTIKYSKKEVVEGIFYYKISDIVGKIAKIALDPQIPVTKNMVLEEGTLNANEVPIGMVAISIPLLNRVSAISYAPQPGDHVNVIAMISFVDLDTDFQTKLPNKVGQVTAPTTGSAGVEGKPATPAELTAKVNIDPATGASRGRAELDSSLGQPLYVGPSESKQRPRSVSQTLVQDAIVLGIGDFLLPSEMEQSTGPTPTPAPGTATTPAPTVTPKPIKYPDTITLIVAPQDAITLNYLVYTGAQLTLVLRGIGDNQRIQTEAVTLQYLLDQYNIPVPVKLPYGTTNALDDVLALPEKLEIPTPVPAP
jgi:Flp pilus assembly protein CpaB